MGTQGLVVRGNSAGSGVGGLHSSGAKHTLTGCGGKEPSPVDAGLDMFAVQWE